MSTYSLNLRHLRAFAKTYELGTLLAASQEIHITQPAVTQGIARIEAFLETRLFDRQNDGMKPTEAADLLYPRATTALELIQSTRVSFTQMRALLALSRHGSYAEASTAMASAGALALKSPLASVADLTSRKQRSMLD